MGVYMPCPFIIFGPMRKMEEGTDEHAGDEDGSGHEDEDVHDLGEFRDDLVDIFLIHVREQFELLGQ